MFDMTAHNFLHNPAMDVFTFGRPPVAIDIITELKGFAFGEAYAAAAAVEQDGITVRLIQYSTCCEPNAPLAAHATKMTWITYRSKTEAATDDSVAASVLPGNAESVCKVAHARKQWVRRAKAGIGRRPKSDRDANE